MLDHRNVRPVASLSDFAGLAEQVPHLLTQFTAGRLTLTEQFLPINRLRVTPRK
jgi:hypothetical protein